MATITRYSRSDPLAPGEMGEAAALVREVQDLVHLGVAPHRPATANEMWEALPRFAAIVREIAEGEDLSDDEVLALMDTYVSRAIAARVRERFLGMLAAQRLSNPRSYGRTERWLGN